MQTRSLATAGCTSPVQALSSNFSPDSRPSWSPTYSPEWVMLHNFSSAFQVSSCQAEWIWLIANLKSQMSWKSWLLQVQNIRFEKQNCIWLYTITAAAVFALQLSAVLDTQQNGWNTAGSLSDHLASKIVFMQISSILRQKKIDIFKFCIQNSWTQVCL